MFDVIWVGLLNIWIFFCLVNLNNYEISEVSASIHEFLLEQLRTYWLVGGMPECISEYVNTKSLKKAAEVQDEICETYRLDFKQFVGQEFATANSNQLYYWARDAKNSNAEIDYLMIFEGMIYPVEVKDGPSGKLRSLHLYRETYQPTWSVVFHAGQTGVLDNEKIVFLPIYFAGAFAQFGINFGSIVKTSV